MHRLLLNREIYTEVLQEEVPLAQQYLWIVTADIKDLHVERRGKHVPFLKVLNQLVESGVHIRLFHAKEPGPRFREDFDRYPALIDSGLFERLLCPRVHMKAIVIDGKKAFLTSANLTGAGMGSKMEHRRNFEAGILTDDQETIGPLMEFIDELYLGQHCTNCGRRDVCPDPIA